MTASTRDTDERRITAVFVTLDEAERLEASVTACRPFADEIVVVDSGSEDDTVEIARSLGCVVFENPWPGYGPQRNFGADRASHDWVFVVDPDEIVGDDLAAGLVRWKSSGGEAAALSVNRVGDFLGRWLEGAAHDTIRLYDRHRCRMTDAPVHEEVDVRGNPVGHIAGTMWHFGFRSLSDHVVRFDRYTTLEAETAFERGQRFRLWRLVLRPPARLAQQVFLHGLYRKGLAGFAVSMLWVYYEMLRELKLWELGWRRRGAPHAPVRPRAGR